MQENRNKDAPGGDRARRQQQNNSDNADYTSDKFGGKGFSGHFDDTRPPSGRVKRRAIELSQWEFGDGNEWEEFVAQAEGDIRWENFEAYLKKRGWVFDARYPRYAYDRPDGGLLYEALRYKYALYPSKKKFFLRHRVGGHEPWIGKAGPVRVPYNLPDLIRRKGEDIVQVEGEKGADAIKKLGLLATCVQGQIWTHEVVEHYVNRTVILAMDNDDGGRAGEARALQWLSKVNARVRILRLPGLLPSQGLDDWFAAGHTVEEFWALVARMPLRGRREVTAYNFPPEEKIARDELLFGSHIMRGEVVCTAAPSGTGKSSLAIVEALSMASGKQLLHDVVPKQPLRVVLINLEENRKKMEQRIAAAMRHHNLTPSDIGDRLIVIAKYEIEIKVASLSRGGIVERNEEHIAMLTNLMIEHQADVLSIDSLIRTHGVHENDNPQMCEVVSCCEEVAGPANCGIHLWHHTRKSGGDRVSVDDARGARAATDAFRSLRMMETMTRKERDELKAIAPDIGEPGYYFRVFNGKRNYAPPSDQSVWFKLVNIKLRNWTSEFEDDGDHIGVVTPWHYPQFDMPTVTPADIERVLATIKAGGPWRADARSTIEPWVGIAVAKALTVDLRHPAAKRAVTKLIKDLLGAGRLIRIQGRDRHREKHDYVEVAGVT